MLREENHVRRAPFARAIVGVVGLVAVLWGARPATAAVTLSQITHGGGFEPSISASGNVIVFDSNLDLTGENAGGEQQIFSYDVASKSFTQITHTTSANVANFRPVADDHGDTIAYFVDRPTNKGSVDPVFVFDRMTKTSVKAAADSNPGQGLALSGNGSQLYFISSADLIGANPDHNDELFRYRTTNGSLHQMTKTTSPSGGLTKFDPSVSRDGKHFALASTDDVAGNGPNDSGDVFLGMLPMSSGFQQITSATMNHFSDEVSVSADGRWLALRSEEDLVAGQNTDHNEEIFLFDRMTSTFKQATHTTPAEIAENFLPVVNGDGTRILFASTGALDPSVGKVGHNEDIFFVDTGTGTITAITNTVSPADNLSQGNPSLSADGKRAVFVSDADLVPGQNTAKNFEVFLATLP